MKNIKLSLSSKAGSSSIPKLCLILTCWAGQADLEACETLFVLLSTLLKYMGTKVELFASSAISAVFYMKFGEIPLDILVLFG